MTALPIFDYLCTDVPFLGGSGLGDGASVAVRGIAELHSLLIFPLVAIVAGAFYVLGMALLGGRGEALRAAGLVGLGLFLAVWGACRVGEGYLLAAGSLLSALQVPTWFQSLKAEGYNFGLGFYTQPYYTGLVFEGVPSLEYLHPGAAAFPESREKGVAVGQKDPVRCHVGLTLAAAPIASRLLVCFPAMLTLFQAIPRVNGPYPAARVHLAFSPSTLFLAAVLLSAFGQLGLYPGYTLTPWGGLVLHVTHKQIRAMEAHYGVLA